MLSNQKTVVALPNLKEHLLDQSEAAFKAENYEEALSYLLELRKYNLEDEEAEMGIMACQVFLGRLEDAKISCEALLAREGENVDDVAETYVSVLLHTQRYEELRAFIPSLRKYGFSASQVADVWAICESMEKEMQQYRPEELWLEREYGLIFRGDDALQQLQVVQDLKERGMKHVYPFLRLFLEAPATHPHVKTAVLHALLEGDIDEDTEVIVRKYGWGRSFSFKYLEELKNSQFAERALRVFEEKWGAQHPAESNMIADYFKKVLYVMFPFVPHDRDTDAWAAALTLFGLALLYEDNVMFNEDKMLESVAKMYGLDKEKLADASLVLRHPALIGTYIHV